MKKTMIDYMQKPKFDDLYTPEYAIKPLLKYIPKGITVWECCDFGNSEITRLLKEHGCKVISSDKEENFFEYIPKEEFDMIITNPPYSLKDEFLERCYKWGKPFCLLLPLTALEGLKRDNMYRLNGIEVMVFDKRVDFTGNKSCWFNVSWFCHNVLPKQLMFEELNK